MAAQLKDAVHNVGFFYITGFGLSQEEVDRQFAIGKEFFALPTEEKIKYKADLEHGNYNGYRPKGSTETLPGKRDNVEMYNVFKFSELKLSADDASMITLHVYSSRVGARTAFHNQRASSGDREVPATHCRRYRPEATSPYCLGARAPGGISYTRPSIQ